MRLGGTRCRPPSRNDCYKEITNIAYNYLNLPQIITFTGSRTITFVYDASGAKLRKITNDNGTIDTYDYVNGVEYKNNILQRFAHTEGSVTRQNDGSYLHEYVLRDHLGNTRVTFTDANNDGTVGESDIKQINNFYPFGLNMEGNWNGAAGNNKYGYNGKEWNDDFGLNWNDYGARFYDASVDRWWSVDPESESGGQSSWNPYHYVFGNPVKNTDPDGREPDGGPGDGVKGFIAGAIGGGIALIGNLTGLDYREAAGNQLYGNTSLRKEFDDAGTRVDKLSVVVGTGMIAGGLLAIEGGGGAAATGVGAPVGIPVAVTGAAAVGIGGILAANGAKNLQNSRVEATHGNKLGDQPAERYTLKDRTTGDVKKHGETTRGDDKFGAGNQKRYTKKYLKDNNVDYVKENSGTKKDMHKEQHDKIIDHKSKNDGKRPDLNKNDY